MMKTTNDRRFRLLRSLLGVLSIFVLFWWPLSHWLYPDFYHQLLGFQPGSYQPAMVKVIGTCGLFPVLLSAFAALNPEQNKACLIILILFCIAIAATYCHLILENHFPSREFVNVGLSFTTAVLLILLFPRTKAGDSNLSEQP